MITVRGLSHAKAAKFNAYCEIKDIISISQLDISDLIEVAGLHYIGKYALRLILQEYMLTTEEYISDYRVLRVYRRNGSKICKAMRGSIDDLNRVYVENLLKGPQQASIKKCLVEVYNYLIFVVDTLEIFSLKDDLLQHKRSQRTFSVDTKFKVKLTKRERLRVKDEDFLDICKEVAGRHVGLSLAEMESLSYMELFMDYSLSKRILDLISYRVFDLYTGHYLKKEIIRSTYLADIFINRYIDQMTFGAIGNLNGVAPETIRIYIKTALLAMRNEYIDKMNKELFKCNSKHSDYILESELLDVFADYPFMVDMLLEVYAPKFRGVQLPFIYYTRGYQDLDNLNIIKADGLLSEIFSNPLLGAEHSSEFKQAIIQAMVDSGYHIYNDRYSQHLYSLEKFVDILYTEEGFSEDLNMSTEMYLTLQELLRVHFGISVDFSLRGLFERLRKSGNFVQVAPGKIQHLINIEFKKADIPRLQQALLEVKNSKNITEIMGSDLFDLLLTTEELNIANEYILYSLVKKYCSSICITSSKNTMGIRFL